MGDQTADKRRKKATDCRFCLRPFLKNIRTRKIIIKWKKDSKVSGYQLQYAKNKNFYYSRTANISKKATSATLRHAGKGSRYYIRIRGYKTIKGTKYYGAWSKVKSCKVVR